MVEYAILIDDVNFIGERRIRRDDDSINSINYYELSGDYLEQLVSEKVCIFSERGRSLKNYLEVSYLKPDFDKIKLKERINERYGLDSIDFMEEKKYIDTFIQNNSIAKNEDEFNEFLNHLQLIKFSSQNFCLPQEYVDYIIKQTLETESVISKNPDTYLHLVECALQDLGKNDLYKSTGEKYLYHTANFVETSVLSSGIAGGYCNSNNKYIKLDRNAIVDFIEKKNLKALDTVFHENTHAKQHYDFINPNMDSYNRYIMQKEEVLRSVFQDFYRKNYSLTFIEIEANEHAALKVAEYIDHLDLSDISKLNFLDSIGEEISKKCDEVVKRKQASYKEGEYKEFDGKSRSIIEVFDEIIKNNPQYIAEYYQLGMEYYEDGRKRSLKEILKYAVNFDSADRTDVVAKIIANGNIMTPETFLDDMEALMSVKLDNDVTNNMIENIIYDNVSNLTFGLMDNMDDFDYVKLHEYKALLQRIQDRVYNVDDAFSRGMRMEYNSYHDSTFDDIIMLQDIVETKINLLDKEDEKDLESIQFLRNASQGVSLDELYELESEFVEREAIDRKDKKRSREERRQKNKQKRKQREDKDSKDS